MRSRSSLSLALALCLCLALPASALANQTLTVEKQGPGISGSSVTSSPSGIACGGECSHSFPDSTLVTLSATPGPNSVAPTWTGCDAVVAGKCEVTMSSAKAVTAIFGLAKHALTVFTTGAGTGAVFSSPGGISCGATCSAEFTHGETVTLSALAGANTEATPQWSGCGVVTAEGKCEVVMSAAKSVTATFNLEKHQLKVSKAGEGNGTITSTPAGINCGSTCSFGFTHGTSLQLSAVPDSLSEPVQWSGCTQVLTGDKCEVTMSSAREVTATFARKPQFVEYPVSVQKTGTGEGTVSAPGAGINCGAACAGKVMNGSSLTLTAIPAPGSVFSHWSGGGCSGSGACTTTVKAAKSITAVFTLSGQRTLSVARAGAGQGTVLARAVGIECGSNCTAQVQVGKKVTLTAKPSDGSSFAHWSGACSGTAKLCTVTMSEARSVTAAFSANPSPTPAPSVPACVVPKLRGKSLKGAKRALAAAHCSLGKVQRPKRARGALVVRSSKPGAGTRLAAGAKVGVRLGAAQRKARGHHKG